MLILNLMTFYTVEVDILKILFPRVFLCVAMFACGHAGRIYARLSMAAKLIVAAKRPPRCSSILNQIMCGLFEQKSCVLNVRYATGEGGTSGNDIERDFVITTLPFPRGTKKQYVLSVLRHRKKEARRVYFSVTELEDDPQAGGSLRNSS